MKVTDRMFVEAELFAADKFSGLDDNGRRRQLALMIGVYANKHEYEDASRLFLTSHDTRAPNGLGDFDARAQLYLEAMLNAVFPELERKDYPRLGWFRVLTRPAGVERFFQRLDAFLYARSMGRS